MASSIKGPENLAARSAITRLFDDTRRRLVETGTRNRLVHVNRANTRGNVLNVVNERSDDVHAILSSAKAMRFLALGRDKDEGPGAITFPDAGNDGFDDARYQDLQLETRLGPDALQKKLLKIAREAQTVEEESGVNILYLALGFLTWFEDVSSSVPREAPLVLLPAELVRNARTSTYDLRMREEDLVTNLPLQQRLLDDFGIELPELEVGDEWSPSDYFAKVADVIAQRQRWKIDADAMQLGFFSFNKLLMFKDLAVDSWPDGALADHALTRGLLYEGFMPEPSLFGGEQPLDHLLPPDKQFHVVDADASQAEVIEEVRAGRNLVVQGPPGTGKSQTITNIIAAAAKEGRRVLFLAEKMAALSVVHDRLVKVGLRDICLELHSRNANKKAVLAELARTLSQATTIPEMPDAPVALLNARDQLNDIAAALHKPIGLTGETPYAVIGRQARFMGAAHAPPTLDTASLATMSREDETRLAQALEHYGERLVAEGSGSAHIFEGARNLDLQPVELERLTPRLAEVRRAADNLREVLNDALLAVGSTAPRVLATTAPTEDLVTHLSALPGSAVDDARALLALPNGARLRELLLAGATWRSKRGEAELLFVEAAFSQPAAAMRAPLAAGTQSFLARWGGAYRGASKELAGLLRGAIPKSAAARVALVDRLMAVATAKAAWESDREYAARVLGDAWRREHTDFTRLLAVSDWCDKARASKLGATHEGLLALAARSDELARIREALRRVVETARAGLRSMIEALDLDLTTIDANDIECVDLASVASRFGSMAEAPGRYNSWVQLARLRRVIDEAGLESLGARMRSGELDGRSAQVELQYARAEALWERTLQESPVLRSLATIDRHDLVQRFAGLERSRLKENVTTILSAHLAQVPQGAQGEMKIIRGEMAKKRGHLAVRRLFERAGTAVQRIKPVLLMSPISVAQFLPPGKLDFDLLVIDEASQVRPEDALGAIARAGQIVVVGDNKQLPPSSFFDRVLEDDEDDQEGDDEDLGPDLLGGAAKLGSMESILTLCEARGLASRMLRWHYRSRDPSLIAVSNQEFYDGGLVLPPSPLQQDDAYGLCFTRVDGAYDKGGKRDNRKEGDAIVARVAEHARNHPTLSLGIVTFSFAQRNLITELLELARRTNAVLDVFLREGQAEDVFVKNIENVQGDERDVILVSVGYGPTTPGGRLSSMSFGPVNGEGGERRLNVLFTRARVRCEVFASFDPGDIDVNRTSGVGPRILKRFLEFAKHGQTEDSSPTGLEADTPFEEDVAEAIRRHGFLADPQVGSAGFRIDIGVRHPDKPSTYLLAVECDGATYHSALWARERDRLRQDVLEHLGWRFHRVWSSDWFYDRATETERLLAALASAREAADAGIRISGANQTRPASVPEIEPGPMDIEIPERVERQMPPYRRAIFQTGSYQEPHEVAITALSGLVYRIVDAEGPVHVEEVARRLAACYGKEKAGSRILSVTQAALSSLLQQDGRMRTDDGFWFTATQADAPPVRDRSAESGATLKAASISILEIDAALRIAREDNAGGDDAELVRAAARLMGFRRVGSELHARISGRIDV